MIRPTDVFTLAYTKLKTHKIRTSITVGVAGILFGLMFAAIFIVQGAFDSVERFDKEGLADRSIVMVSNMQSNGFNTFNYLDDKEFIAEVEALRSKSINKKEAAAKKYNIDYNPEVEDPSPISINSETKRKTISEGRINSRYVRAATEARIAANSGDKFDIYKYLEKYDSARVLDDYYQAAPKDGAMVYMKDGKEAIEPLTAENGGISLQASGYGDSNLETIQPIVVDSSVTAAFVANQQFNPQQGNIPVIVPYADATKLLGLKPLDKKADPAQRLQRLEEVRSRINEVKFSYCYRNTASQQLLDESVAQAAEFKRLSQNPTIDFVRPSLEYKVPSATSCGAVKVSRDVRTAEEKQQAANQEKYDKAIGQFIGQPVQQKITFQGVGIVAETGVDRVGIGDMVMGIIGSNLGYGTMAIPADLLKQVPEKFRPAAIFSSEKPGYDDSQIPSFERSSYLVEFEDKAEARQILEETGALLSAPAETGSSVFASQFGSNALLVDELKKLFTKVVLWALVGIGGVAVIILGSMIGRTVSEGRRESAVFRAIGAKRTDIASIYSCYAFLLSLRVAAFALVLGGLVAFVTDLLIHESATVGARLAYAARDTTAEFHIFSVLSWYVPLVIAVIIVAGVLGSLIPIIRSVRRNPINDMRDE